MTSIRDSARKGLAAYCTNASELRDMLDMLALWPAQDDDMNHVTSVGELRAAMPVSKGVVPQTRARKYRRD